jgi:hypothetical protein
MTTPSASWQISPGSVGRAPAPAVSRASAPPMWRSWEQGDVLRQQRVERPGRQLVERVVREVERDRVHRVHGQVGQHDGRDHRERVAHRAEAARRLEQRAAFRGLPQNAAARIANERLRPYAGTSGSGGKWMTVAQDISSSGKLGSSSRHAWRTSPARSNSKHSPPA